MSRNAPAMSEWVLNEAHAISIELVRNRLQYLRSIGHGALHRGIDIFNVKQHAHGRIAQRERALVTHLGKLIGQHDVRVANLQFSMPNAAVGTRHAHNFGCSENILVVAVSYTHLTL